MNQKLNFLFVTGSTGGHIFPIIPLALELKRKGHNIFIISSGSLMEKKILNKNRLSFFSLPVGRLGKGVCFFERVCTIISLPFWILRSFYLILKLKPRWVIGTGGAVSGPVLLSACLLKPSTVAWELNAVSGLTNKILSRFVDYIFIQFEEVKKFFPKEKCLHFSLPVREGDFDKKREPDGYFHLLVLGGSQGSHQINQAVLDMYNKEKLEIWKIRHQTGERDFSSVQSVYGDDDRIECRPFFENMGDCYIWADVVVCRAGAVTLAELSAYKKATIVIPLLTLDQHQIKNALALSGAVEILSIENLTGEVLFESIMKINSYKKKRLEENIRKFFHPESIEKIIHHLTHK